LSAGTKCSQGRPNQHMTICIKHCLLSWGPKGPFSVRSRWIDACMHIRFNVDVTTDTISAPKRAPQGLFAHLLDVQSHRKSLSASRPGLVRAVVPAHWKLPHTAPHQLIFPWKSSISAADCYLCARSEIPRPLVSWFNTPGNTAGRLRCKWRLHALLLHRWFFPLILQYTSSTNARSWHRACPALPIGWARIFDRIWSGGCFHRVSLPCHLPPNPRHNYLWSQTFSPYLSQKMGYRVIVFQVRQSGLIELWKK